MNRDALLGLFEETATMITERDLGAVTESTQIAALGIDSLGMLELVGEMERTLGIHLPDDQLVGLLTVRDLLDLVERRRAVSPPAVSAS